MDVRDIIGTKRYGNPLSAEQIHFFIKEYAAGNIPDYQAAALLMAVAIQGMSPDELSSWTDAMLHSGKVLDLGSIPGIKMDKHSTGGVGDKISICLAPMVAACGVAVPMISGRGLGHTGGTLDKLEAIPGFDVSLSTDRFIELVGAIGLCLIGQTEDLAPADRKLYALRDVTGTVESIPLIASSIMSKKLAEGIDGLVLDVKVGRGAFMKTQEDARKLAETLISIGVRAKKKVTAFLTKMDDVLGHEVGNGLETREALDVLKGKGPEDVKELTLRLGMEMLVLGEKAENNEQALEMLEETISSRSALFKMKDLIKAQGGNPAVIDDPGLLPQAAYHEEIPSSVSGIIQFQDSLKIARAAMMVGAGRQRSEDSIDPAVGITVNKKTGESVTAGEPLAVLHHNGGKQVESAKDTIASAFETGSSTIARSSLIIDVIKSH